MRSPPRRLSGHKKCAAEAAHRKTTPRPCCDTVHPKTGNDSRTYVFTSMPAFLGIKLCRIKSIAAHGGLVKSGCPRGGRPLRGGACHFFSLRRKEVAKEKGGKRRGLKSRPLLLKPPQSGGGRFRSARTGPIPAGDHKGRPYEVSGALHGRFGVPQDQFPTVGAGPRPARIARVTSIAMAHLLHRPILFVGATLAVARVPGRGRKRAGLEPAPTALGLVRLIS